MNWFCVMTQPTREEAVNAALRASRLETLFCHYTYLAKHARRQYETIKPLFARYIFVAAPLERLHEVNTTQGVSYILGGPDGPHPIPETEIERLKSGCDENGLIASPDQPKKRDCIPAGTKVRITEGPLTGYDCIVLIDKSKHITVNVEAFGGHIPADVLPSAVRVLNAP